MFQKKELTDEDRVKMGERLKASQEAAAFRRNQLIERKLKKTRQPEPSPNSLEHSEIHGFRSFFKKLHEICQLEEFQRLILNKDVIESAKSLISYIEDGAPKKEPEDKSATKRSKVLLSLILIAKFPNETLPNPSKLEESLIDHSNQMLCSFLKYFTTGSVEKQALAWKWIESECAFEEWSTGDREMLLFNMRSDFLSWTRSMGDWQLDHESHSEWAPHVIAYQNKILKRLFKIFGADEIKKLQDDIEDLNKAFPKATMHLEFDSNANVYQCRWIEKEAIPATKNAQKPTINGDIIDGSLKRAPEVTNIAILHELMLKEENINFDSILNMNGSSMSEISEKNKSALETITSILSREDDSKVISKTLTDLFEFICKNMSELTGDNDDYSKEIAQIDCFVDEQDWLKDTELLMHNVLSICRKLCAPARDKFCNLIEERLEQIHEVDKNGIAAAMANVFSSLFELLTLMRSDICNFRMRLLASRLEGKGVAEQYELDEFRNTFRTYPKTIRWLQKKSLEKDKSVDALVESFLNLFDPFNEELKPEQIPETFYLDVSRVIRLRSSVKNNMIVGCIDVYTKTVGKASSESLAQVQKILEYIKNGPADANLSKDEILRGLLNSIQDPEMKIVLRKIKGLLAESKHDQVFMLLRNRLLCKLKCAIMAAKKVDCENDAQEKIVLLCRYNMAIYANVYDQIFAAEEKKAKISIKTD